MKTVLSDEKIDEILRSFDCGKSLEEFIRHIEQAVLNCGQVKEWKKDSDRLQWVIDEWFSYIEDKGAWMFAFNEAWHTERFSDIREAIDDDERVTKEWLKNQACNKGV